jgi:flagellar biosynthesis protein FlhG
VLCQTAVPGLSLVSGARAALEMANPKHAQKQKFIRHLRRLDVAHVFVDLGAGTSFNVLDPFVAADERVVVVTPEPTSIENAYHFLRAAFFRWLRDVARGEHRELLEGVIATGRRSGLSPRQLLELASRRDPGVAYKLRKRARAFAPKLIVNQVDNDDDRRVGYEMVAAAWRHLGVRLDFVGTLDRDASVRAAVTRQQPVLQLFPGCGFSTELREVVGRIRACETLRPEQAPLGRPLCNATPPLATHGVAEVEVALPRLGPRPPPPPLPAIDLEWPGRSLRRCREHLGLSLRDAEERSRIRHVAAIEAERYSDLPPEPYLEAQVRSYAEVLGIRDAVLLAARFAQAARKTQPVPRRGLLARLRRAPNIDVLPPRAHS